MASAVKYTNLCNLDNARLHTSSTVQTCNYTYVPIYIFTYLFLFLNADKPLHLVRVRQNHVETVVKLVALSSHKMLKRDLILL